MGGKENILLPPDVLRNNSRLVGLEAYQRHIKVLYSACAKKPVEYRLFQGGQF